MVEIFALLNQLAGCFEAKEHHVLPSLLDPLSSEQLNNQCAWFPATIPDSISAMYAWRAGQAKDAWTEEYPFWFRDMSFISPKQAEYEYKSMIESYGIDNTIEEDGIELRTSFPFAAFNGGWFVVPSSSHKWSSRHPSPVICVFQGIDMYFHSVESMLRTCSEWVAHPNWSSEESDLEEDIEIAIWKKYNPGIFDDEI